MHTFQCADCLNHLESEYANIGLLVECPICGSHQIVPDAVIPNDTFFNAYKIAGMLRCDLLWSTYLAYDSSPDENRVILKIPTTFFLKNVGDMELFFSKVVEIHQSGIAGVPVLLEHSLQFDNRFLVFEYFKLAHRVGVMSSNREITHHVAVRIILQVATTLKNLHNKFNLIHCNLNPETVRFRKWDDSVLLTELGFSEQLLADDNLLQSGFSVWSPEYMAPELLQQGDMRSPKIDFYSLGCLLRFMLTGEHPAPPKEDSEQFEWKRTSESAKIPEPVMELCDILTAFDPSDRPDSWEYVIGRIESVLPFLEKSASVVEYRNKFNLWGVYTKVPPSKTSLKGSTPGRNAKKFHLRKNETRSQHSKHINQPERPTSTLAKIAKQHRMEDTINSRWTSKKRLQQSTSSNKLVPFVIAALVIIPLLGLGIFMLFLINKNESITKQQAKTTSETDQTTPTVHSIPETPKEISGKKTLIAAPRQKPPKSSDLDVEMVDIAKFHTTHPKKFDTILNKYHALEREAQGANLAPLVDSIAAKIAEVEAEKRAAVETVMAQISEKVDNWASRGARFDAVRYLLRYNGAFARETKRDRYALMRRLQSPAGKSSGKLLPNSKEVDLVFNLIDQIAKNLLNDKLGETKKELNKALKNPELASAKNILRPLIRNINYYQKLDATIMKTYHGYLGKTVRISLANGKNTTVRITALTPSKIICEAANDKRKKLSYTLGDLSTGEIIRAVDRLAVKNTLLLKGLIYKRRSEYDKAMETLSGIEYGLGNPFMMELFDIKTLAELNGILSKFNLPRYDGKDAKLLLLALSRRKISAPSARKLRDQIQKLINEEASMEFMKVHGHVCDALLLYASRNIDVSISKEESIANRSGAVITIKHPDDLYSALKEAPPDSTIHLPKGVYELPLKNALNLTQWGLRIMGESGSVINGSLTISGQSVVLEHLSFGDGVLKIVKGADKIKIDNCRFRKTKVVVETVSKASFANSFIATLQVVNCDGVTIDHCTIVDDGLAPSEGLLNAPLVIVGTGISTSNSVIYGKKFAIWFDNTLAGVRNPEAQRRLTAYKHSSKYKSKYLAKRRLFNKCMLYGETAIAGIDDGRTVKKSSKLKKFCKIKSCLFSPPVFLNPRKGAWNIIKGAPGAATKSKPPTGVDWSRR